MDNRIKIEVESKLCNISIIRVALTSFVSNAGLALDEIMEIKTAVSEAVTNSIEHAYKDDNNIVVLTAKLSNIDGMQYISIVVEDFGQGIEDIELATTPGYTTKPEMEHAGMGFTIMETFMDEIIIDSEVGKGTKITMTKKLSTRVTNKNKGESSNE